MCNIWYSDCILVKIREHFTCQQMAADILWRKKTQPSNSISFRGLSCHLLRQNLNVGAGMKWNEKNFSSCKRLTVDGFALFIRKALVHCRCVPCRTFRFRNPRTVCEHKTTLHALSCKSNCLSEWERLHFHTLQMRYYHFRITPWIQTPSNFHYLDLSWPQESFDVHK